MFNRTNSQICLFVFNARICLYVYAPMQTFNILLINDFVEYFIDQLFY